MANKISQLSSRGRTTLKKWFHFLLYVNDKPPNRDLLVSYFLQQFSADPGAFYHFLRFFQRTMEMRFYEKQRLRLAGRYLEILSPLAERFGVFRQKRILDTLCFKLVSPTAYQALENRLMAYKKDSRAILVRVLRRLNALLHPRYEYQIRGRYKNIYSIYRKTERKKVDALQLNDIFAFRIIAKSDSIDDCFGILFALQEAFTPVIKTFKDYITVPKVNGYRSIHTVITHVIPDLDLPVEIQIRTALMDKMAEYGSAAHWLYARDKKLKNKPLSAFLTLTDTPKNNKIYCLSPKGDIFVFETGCTVLDFAYDIHTDFGHRTSGALVNDVLKRPSYRLQDGDRVEIIKSDQLQVRIAWKQQCFRKNTRKRISEYLNAHDAKKTR